MGMVDAEIFAIIRNADDRWGKFKDRSDRNRRLSDLIGVVRNKYPEGTFAVQPMLEEMIPVFGLKSLLASTIEIEWVVEGLLQKQGYMLLSGPSGVGKTQFSLQWAIHM